MDWTETMIADLRADWDGGYSASVIGKRNGWTKCAVIGKAHRLGLEARRSPIGATGKRSRTPRERVPTPPKVTLPRLSPVVPPAPVREPPRSAPGEAAGPFGNSRGTCQWVITERRGRQMPQFCDKPVASRLREGERCWTAWCAEHLRVVYPPRGGDSDG